jgi:hypothetical protein
MSVKALTAACVLHAAQAYDMPWPYLAVILDIEGGRVGQVRENANGTKDYGPFQINGVNIPAFAEHIGRNEARTRRLVRDNGCVNAQAAAWHLARKRREAATWTDAIGHYHSKTPAHKHAYMRRFLERAKELFPQIRIKGQGTRTGR